MNYHHIGFSVPKMAERGRVVREVQKALGSVALDWVRYGNFSWITYSFASVDQIYIALREVVKTNEGFLVLPIDLQNAPRQGYLAPWLWEWLSVDRTRPGWMEEVDRIISTLTPPPPPPSPPPDYSAFIEALGRLSLSPPKDDK